MNEPFKIDRKLPPHELNARRARKRILTKLPGIAGLPDAHPHHHPKERPSPNDTVYNPATNWVNDQSARENQQ